MPIVHRPLLNEEHGATAVMGSQLAAEQPDCEFDGMRGFGTGKHPVRQSGDALRHAVFTGTSRLGGAVAIVGDDLLQKVQHFHQALMQRCLTFICLFFIRVMWKRY
ncbi:MAG: hypothetical protein Ct9H90mP30_5990 [Actinomycetota bacterium]|nr:MAG: hypothetical protein Ct9H90mP30_5990 [Actinomycetota bacterium]